MQNRVQTSFQVVTFVQSETMSRFKIYGVSKLSNHRYWRLKFPESPEISQKLAHFGSVKRNVMGDPSRILHSLGIRSKNG